VYARAVILAAGAFATPQLLLKQGIANSSKQIGRHLTVHPSGATLGLFDQLVDGARHIPQAEYTDQFLSEGLLILSAQPDSHMLPGMLPFVGERLMQLVEKHRNIGGMGFLASDHKSGRLRLGPGGRPIVTYRLTRDDVRRLHHGHSLVAELFLSAGAKEVYPGLTTPMTLRSKSDLEAFRARRISAGQFMLTAFHPLGTCRMSARPDSGVVDLNHQSHDVPHLFVVDGSVVRGPLGVNPQLSIMALAHRAAEKIDAFLNEAPD
jgi:choline dehydrogenase-like flavoprotein